MHVPIRSDASSMKLYIVVISKGDPSVVGAAMGEESYQYFQNASYCADSPEEAKEKALVQFGIVHPEEYDITVI